MSAFQSTVTESQARLLESIERGEMPDTSIEDLEVTGTATIDTLEITEDATVGGTLTVSGSDLIAEGDASVEGALSVGGNALITGAGTLGEGLGVWGTSAPGAQPGAIADVAGGAVVDAEARTAVNSILAALRGAGLIDT